MRTRLALAAVAVLTAVPAAGATRLGRWQPRPGTTWQIQLQGTVDVSVPARVYDVDGFEATPELVAALHARGRKAICYLSAGSWEDWRPDASRYPADVIGEPLAGWPGESWVDVRRLDVLGPILRDRMAMCRAKGFDAVDLANVDVVGHDSGFPITRADQLRFARWLGRTAHGLGLSIGLKNAPSLVPQLVREFDFAVVEECFELRECARYSPFVRAGKGVFAIEYRIAPARFCPRARGLRFSALRKRLELDAWRRACPAR